MFGYMWFWKKKSYETFSSNVGMLALFALLFFLISPISISMTFSGMFEVRCGTFELIYCLHVNNVLFTRKLHSVFKCDVGLVRYR